MQIRFDKYGGRGGPPSRSRRVASAERAFSRRTRGLRAPFGSEWRDHRSLRHRFPRSARARKERWKRAPSATGVSRWPRSCTTPAPAQTESLVPVGPRTQVRCAVRVSRNSIDLSNRTRLPREPPLQHSCAYLPPMQAAFCPHTFCSPLLSRLCCANRRRAQGRRCPRRTNAACTPCTAATGTTRTRSMSRTLTTTVM